MTDVPEIEEYITSYGWTATCTAPDCNWTDYADEKTVDWMEELHAVIENHKKWHEDGMPE